MLSNQPEPEDAAVLEEENRRLRAALGAAQEKGVTLAKENEALAFRNEELLERSREAHAQMRLMRNSTSWRMGSVFRYARQMGGKAARNIRNLTKSGLSR